MDWAIDFSETVTKDNLLLVKETLDAKHQTELGNHDTAARILTHAVPSSIFHGQLEHVNHGHRYFVSLSQPSELLFSR